MGRMLIIAINVLVAVVVLVPFTFIVFTMFVGAMGLGWLGGIGGIIGVVVLYGLSGLLFSLAPGLSKKIIGNPQIFGDGEDSLTRAIYLMPSLVFGVILNGFYLYSALFGVFQSSSSVLITISAILFLILANGAMAGGLWHRRLRQGRTAPPADDDDTTLPEGSDSAS